MKLLICLAFGLVTISAEPSVKTSLGTITGRIEKVSDIEVESFLAIPFAKPPVGDLRFALPVDFGDLGDFDATRTPVMCPQPPTPTIITKHFDQNEDCLQLNIYRKLGTSNNSKKPVIITVHGGAYIVGSGSDIYQSAIPLAAYEDCIIVSPNYRLGILGFGDMGDLAPGNLGFHDQRLAIKWVHDNIEAFGGDPNRVTLMGVSTGSQSIGAHIVTPLNKERHFQSVVMDAGAINGFGNLEKSSNSFKKVLKIAENINCPTKDAEMVKCLREKDAQELVKLSYVTGLEHGVPTFVATEDGTFIPRDLNRLKGNNFMKVRMIIGYSRNEGAMFALQAKEEKPKLDTAEDFLEWIKPFLKQHSLPIDLENKEQVGKFVDQYFNKYVGAFNLSAEIQGDGFFICPINQFIKEFAKYHDNVFAYEFDRKLQQAYFGMFDPEILGAFHYSPYLHFSGAAFAQDDAVIPDLDKQYFLDSMKMIANFAKSVDEIPSFRGVKWPDYSKTGEALLFHDTPTLKRGLTHDCKCKNFFLKPEPENIRTDL